MAEQRLSINEYAQQSVIPRKTLLYLQRKELIQEPLSAENLAALHLLEKVWGEAELLRPQLGKMSRPSRERFIRTIALHSKWERYAYSRYFNQKRGKSLTLKQVAEEIEVTFGFSLNRAQIKRIRQIRSRAQTARYRLQKRDTASYIAQTKKEETTFLARTQEDGQELLGSQEGRVNTPGKRDEERK